MGENKKETGFWHTLPGVLTAIGGIIGASAALITALYSAGIIGSKQSTADGGNSQTPEVSVPSTPQQPPLPQPQAKAWDLGWNCHLTYNDGGTADLWFLKADEQGNINRWSLTMNTGNGRYSNSDATRAAWNIERHSARFVLEKTGNRITKLMHLKLQNYDGGNDMDVFGTQKSGASQKGYTGKCIRR